jgi:PKD repeat protein
VEQNVPVTFDALSLERAGDTPFKFEWNFEGKEVNLIEQMETPRYRWPNPEAPYTYVTPGVYKASLSLVGDYGTSVLPFTVKVLGTKQPVAKFTVPGSVVATQSATFDASTSESTEGSEISSYRWEFSDGSKATTQSPQVSHTFANAGEASVTLTVVDAEVGMNSEPETHKFTVAAAPSSSCGSCGGGGTTTTTTSAPPPTITTPIVTPPPAGIKPKPLTNAQKLAAALRACKKEPKKRRAGCVKQAEKKYAPKKKSKSKKKK